MGSTGKIDFPRLPVPFPYTGTCIAMFHRGKWRKVGHIAGGGGGGSETSPAGLCALLYKKNLDLTVLLVINKTIEKEKQMRDYINGNYFYCRFCPSVFFYLLSVVPVIRFLKARKPYCNSELQQ